LQNSKKSFVSRSLKEIKERLPPQTSVVIYSKEVDGKLGLVLIPMLDRSYLTIELQ